MYEGKHSSSYILRNWEYTLHCMYVILQYNRKNEQKAKFFSWYCIICTILLLQYSVWHYVIRVGKKGCKSWKIQKNTYKIENLVMFVSNIL
jgi:hypothetical protein